MEHAESNAKDTHPAVIERLQKAFREARFHCLFVYREESTVFTPVHALVKIMWTMSGTLNGDLIDSQ